MRDEPGVLRIGEVSRRTGVAVPTLRAWERRYGLLDPDRTEGGHRLYREDDVTRVQAMSALLADGWSAAAAARQVLREPASVTPLRPVPGGGEGGGPGDGGTAGMGSGDAAAGLIQRLDRAIDTFDAADADLVVDDVLARLEIPSALDEVLLPVLRRIGDGWEKDPRVIAREHFATNTLRPRLQRLLRVSAGSPTDRVCLAAAPEGEEHDLGLLASAVVAAHAGWRVHYLGPRTPTSALQHSIRELAPRVVLLGTVYRAHAEALLAEEPDLGPCGIVLGGSGFLPDDVTRLPRSVLHEGNMRELPATLDRALRQRQAI